MRKVHAVRGVSFTAYRGEAIGLIGSNGSGKSTLLRLLSGEEEPDAGRVERPAATGFLYQELPYGPATTLAQVLEEALTPARRVERRLTQTAAA
ncbi:ATP-binding cassette domain-containing protein, partial [Nocardiopsis tropica]|nr:ATP-binding cassette domain-containing protein [Nocardiopsis tropica]